MHVPSHQQTRTARNLDCCHVGLLGAHNADCPFRHVRGDDGRAIVGVGKWGKLLTIFGFPLHTFIYSLAHLPNSTEL